jgi:hypothetical protein
VHPSTTHFKLLALVLSSPGPATDTVTSFNKEDGLTWEGVRGSAVEERKRERKEKKMEYQQEWGHGQRRDQRSLLRESEWAIGRREERKGGAPAPITIVSNFCVFFAANELRGRIAPSVASPDWSPPSLG